MRSEICQFCNKEVDSHYDYRFDDAGNAIGNGYTPCLDSVLGGVAAAEWHRVNFEE